MKYCKSSKQLSVTEISDDAPVRVKEALVKGDIILEFNGINIQYIKSIQGIKTNVSLVLFIDKSTKGRRHSQFKIQRDTEYCVTRINA